VYPSWHTLQSLCVPLVTHTPVLCVHVVPHTLVYMCIISGTYSSFCVPLVTHSPLVAYPPDAVHTICMCTGSGKFSTFCVHRWGIHLKSLWIKLVPRTAVLFSVFKYCRILQFLVSFLSRVVLFFFTFHLITLLLYLYLNRLFTQIHSFVLRHNTNVLY